MRNSFFTESPDHWDDQRTITAETHSCKHIGLYKSIYPTIVFLLAVKLAARVDVVSLLADHFKATALHKEKNRSYQKMRTRIISLT